jgi:hypothetical protein
VREYNQFFTARRLFLKQPCFFAGYINCILFLN